jgi:hypothetical protein
MSESSHAENCRCISEIYPYDMGHGRGVSVAPARKVPVKLQGIWYSAEAHTAIFSGVSNLLQLHRNVIPLNLAYTEILTVTLEAIILSFRFCSVTEYTDTISGASSVYTTSAPP